MRPKRLALTWILLLAFALQSYVTQTHLHGAGPGTGRPTVEKLLQSPGPDKLPSDNQLSDCPFCQAIAHSGVFFSPTAPLLVLPIWAGYSAPFLAVHTDRDTTARHSWQSRAPPQR